MAFLIYGKTNRFLGIYIILVMRENGGSMITSLSRDTTLSNEYQFFLFLLEYYADAKGISGAVVLEQWDDCGVTEEIVNGYECYHIESLDNAVEDIDHLI